LTLNRLCYILCNIFQNSPGHPVPLSNVSFPVSERAGLDSMCLCASRFSRCPCVEETFLLAF
jgi:hypothetical protein